MQRRWRYARVSGTALSSVGVPKPRNFKDQVRWRAAKTGMSSPLLWLSALGRAKPLTSILLARRNDFALVDRSLRERNGLAKRDDYFRRRPSRLPKSDFSVAGPLGCCESRARRTSRLVNTNRASRSAAAAGPPHRPCCNGPGQRAAGRPAPARVAASEAKHRSFHAT